MFPKITGKRYKWQLKSIVKYGMIIGIGIQRVTLFCRVRHKSSPNYRPSYVLKSPFGISTLVMFIVFVYEFVFVWDFIVWDASVPVHSFCTAHVRILKEHNANLCA